jgi:hypothetical protein
MELLWLSMLSECAHARSYRGTGMDGFLSCDSAHSWSESTDQSVILPAYRGTVVQRLTVVACSQDA